MRIIIEDISECLSLKAQYYSSVWKNSNGLDFLTETQRTCTKHHSTCLEQGLYNKRRYYNIHAD